MNLKVLLIESSTVNFKLNPLIPLQINISKMDQPDFNAMSQCRFYF